MKNTITIQDIKGGTHVICVNHIISYGNEIDSSYRYVCVQQFDKLIPTLDSVEQIAAKIKAALSED